MLVLILNCVGFRKACKAQRFLSSVSAAMVMWSLKNNLEKMWIGLTKARVFVKTVQQKRVFGLGLE